MKNLFQASLILYHLTRGLQAALSAEKSLNASRRRVLEVDYGRRAEKIRNI